AWAFSTAWNARRSFANQRARASRSRASRSRSRARRRCWAASGEGKARAGRTTRRRGSVMSGALADPQPNAAVLALLLGQGMAFLSCFESGFLHRIQLEQPVQLLRVAPGAAVVVVAHLAAGGVDDGGVGPAGEVDDEAGGLAAVEPGGAV